MIYYVISFDYFNTCIEKKFADLEYKECLEFIQTLVDNEVAFKFTTYGVK